MASRHCPLYIYCCGQSKPASKYVAASQIEPLFNVAGSQNSLFNRWRLVKSRRKNITMVNQIVLLFNMSLSQNFPLYMWQSVKLAAEYVAGCQISPLHIIATSHLK
jgi:hypothetical protein